MQWVLEFLELPQAAQQHHGQLLDDEVLGKALIILVRMLAQASEGNAQSEAVDE
ncbi:MAG TPA: hypothetical protein VF742_02400 [Terracidiphilus sp.]